MSSAIKLAPSILTADFGHIADEVQAAEAAGADYIHVDVMDGQFVPNITLGPVIVEGIRRATSLPLDVHLMIVQPERLIQAFVDAGATILTVHVEATPHLHRAVDAIKRAGARAGAAINPATPVVMLEEILPDLDLALIMSVNPGWGGQPFLRNALSKLERLHATVEAQSMHAEIEVDGGVDATIASDVVRAGASVVVAGSAIYNQRESVAAACQRLRESFSRT